MNLADKVLNNYTWLIPAIIKLHDRIEITRRDLCELLGISQDLARAIIWMLIRLKLVEKTTETGKYKVKSSLKEISSIFLKLLVGERKYNNTIRIVLFKDNFYYIIVVRKRRIISRKVDREIVEKIEELLRERKMSIKEISKEIPVAISKICDALRVLEVRGVLKKFKDKVTGKTLYLIN